METIILIIHVLLAIALVALVLLQQGKGAEAGAAFGGGASQTMFGSRGAGSFLGRVTAVIAIGIFITSFALAVYAKQKAESIADQGIPQVVEQKAPAAADEVPALQESEVPVQSGDEVPQVD